MYLLAYDIGTSGVKSVLFSTEGKLIEAATVACPLLLDGKRAEQNPEDWWKAVCAGTCALLGKVDAEKISCVSFSGQAQGCVCVDRHGALLRNAMIHSDQRAERQAQQIQDKIGESRYYEVTGARISPSYSLEKLMWVRQNEPDIYRNTYKMLAAKDYIVYKLTGHMCTDQSDASMTGAFSLAKLTWQESLIEEAGLDQEKFPEIHSSVFVAGGVTGEASKATGLKKNTPVVLGGSDGPCGFFGIAGADTEKSYLYMGSSSTASAAMNGLIPDETGRAGVNCHVIPGYYRYYATMQASGTTYDWMRSQLARGSQGNDKATYMEVEQALEKSPAGAKGLIFLPYLLGERSPRWDPFAKGAMIGIGAGHTREDMMRAVVEGISCNMKLNFEIVNRIPQNRAVVLYGGNSQSAIWSQCYADILEREIWTPELAPAAAPLGAAVLGGIGTGVYRDYKVIHKFVKIKKVAEPIPENVGIYKGKMHFFEECYQALKEIFRVDG